MLTQAQTDSALQRIQALHDSLAAKYGTILQARASGFPSALVDQQLAMHDALSARVAAVESSFAAAYDASSSSQWAAFVQALEGVEREESAFRPRETFTAGSSTRTTLMILATMGSVAVGGLLAVGVLMYATRSAPRARRRRRRRTA